MAMKELLKSSIDLVWGGRCDCWCEVCKQDAFVGGVPSPIGTIYWDKSHKGIVESEPMCRNACGSKTGLNSNSRFLKCDPVP